VGIPARTIEIEASIASLAPGGDGVAHAEIGGERRAVFVPYAAPGDVARVEVDPSHRPARGRIVSLTTAGADRVAPACPWSTRCGGCDWMHLSTAAQARSHVEHLRAALPAGWPEMPIESTPAPRPLAYRTRARVHVRSVSRGRIVVGMNEARSHEPVEVESCAVLHPAVEGARRLIAPLLAGSRGKGDVQLALGSGGIPVLAVRWEGDVASETFGRLEAAVADGALAGADVTVGAASRPARVGDPMPWMTGEDGTPLRLAAGGFGQANDDVNAALARHVAALVHPWGAERAVELHAGSGNLSVLLAREVGALTCIESNRDACDAARANLAARGLSGAKVVEADAESYVWSKATQLIVLDPPRTGARGVAERLVDARVGHVVYVSCDTQTLGRDLAILETAYTPVSLATFEMFPQTSHVESVVALQRRRAS
jgi:23S rRNA (uracil1939-C5)-methyltransferase